MGTFTEYIKKSQELFGYIGGKYSVKPETVERLKKEYDDLVTEVALNDGYPTGIFEDSCGDPDLSGYIMAMEVSSFTKKELAEYGARLERFKDSGEGYIGNIIALKSRFRYAVFTKNPVSIKAIVLGNELFYKTPPIQIVMLDKKGNIRIKNTRRTDVGNVYNGINKPEIQVTGWDDIGD